MTDQIESTAEAKNTVYISDQLIFIFNTKLDKMPIIHESDQSIKIIYTTESGIDCSNQLNIWTRHIDSMNDKKFQCKCTE